ncbi:Ig-like domain-containing protein [Anaerovorax odorimutans]|uniref:Ig-like domain-containing protein n=1 Tax=Anaerovorax odorimutans TaxID=109327 RepID=A0ABT1RJG5_9FIRM|nr:Ig-like domain-containing protein [Anaerovorax odorimutans]MCQ4635332.1 Ig-like domain-containing protein [Anaerovorax odorimutans]
MKVKERNYGNPFLTVLVIVLLAFAFQSASVFAEDIDASKLSPDGSVTSFSNPGGWKYDEAEHAYMADFASEEYKTLKATIDGSAVLSFEYKVENDDGSAMLVVSDEYYYDTEGQFKKVVMSIPEGQTEMGWMAAYIGGGTGKVYLKNFSLITGLADITVSNGKTSNKYSFEDINEEYFPSKGNVTYTVETKLTDKLSGLKLSAKLDGDTVSAGTEGKIEIPMTETSTERKLELSIDNNGKTYTKTVTITPAQTENAGVTIEGDPQKGTVTAICDQAPLKTDGTVNEITRKSSVTVKATPNSGVDFLGWVDGEGRFLSTDKEYSFTVEKNIKLKAVFSKNDYAARINGEFYASLKTALDSAKAGDTVILTGDTALTENTVVPKDVFLLLPTDATDTKGYAASGYCPDGTSLDSSTGLGKKATLYHTLTIGENVSLDINGSVLVNAVVGRPQGGHNDQDITGGYSQINLQGSINVEDGGILDVCGYVKGKGKIHGKAGSEIRDLFVIRHWRGGSQALKMYLANVFPFTEYDCHNIQAPTRIDYGASLLGTVKMYASSTYNYTRFPQIDGNNGMYRLKDTSSYAMKTYENGIENISLYGGGTFSNSTLDITGLTLSTKSYLYPIDGDYQYELNDGEYIFDNDYKFMPGSKVTVRADAKLTIPEKKKVVFYDSFEDPTNISGTQYPQDRTPAQLVLNGTLDLKGTLAGQVLCGKESFVSRECNAGLTLTTKEASGDQKGTKTYTFNLTWLDAGGKPMEAPAAKPHIGDWTSDAQNHTRACPKCGTIETEAHQYDSWSSTGDTQHKHACTVCGYEETADHQWGKAVENAEETELVYTCEDCGAQKIEKLVTGISLNKKVVEIAKGNKELLIAKLEPEDAADKTITWSSSNEDVATVDENGLVTAKDAGNTMITAKSNSKERLATCAVSVMEEPGESIPGAGESPTVTVQPQTNEAGTLDAEPVIQLIEKSGTDETVVILLEQEAREELPSVPAEVFEKAAATEGAPIVIQTVTKEDDKIAATFVFERSEITKPDIPVKTDISKTPKTNEKALLDACLPDKAAKKTLNLSHSGDFPGPVMITLDVSDTFKAGNIVHLYYLNTEKNNLTLTAETLTVDPKGQITVKLAHASSYVVTDTIYKGKNITGITLDKSKVTLEAGKKTQLHASVQPEDAADKTVTWSSSKEKVAKVSQSGEVTALTPGSAEIYGKTADGRTAVCKVEVRLAQTAGLKAVSKEYDKTRLTWKKTAGAKGYKIYRAASKNGKYKKIKTTKATNYTDKKLKTGKTYYYKVRAYADANGKTTHGAYTSVKKVKVIPAAPKGVKAKAGKNRSVKFTWNKVQGASGYEIYRSKADTKHFKKIRTAGKASKSYKSQNLSKKTKYYYKVRAYRKVAGKKVYSKYSKTTAVFVK